MWARPRRRALLDASRLAVSKLNGSSAKIAAGPMDEQTVANGFAPMAARQPKYDATPSGAGQANLGGARDDGSSIEAMSGQNNSGRIDSGWASPPPARAFPANPPGPRRKEKIIRLPQAALSPDQSSELRDRLIAALDLLASSGDAADWAFNNLLAKNALTTEDAKLVEAGFPGQACGAR
jgi:hypothetical protein